MPAETTNPSDSAVDLNHVTFSYPACDAFVKDCSLHLPKGSRCLLVGANGAGKTTLLQIVAGKYMVGKESVYVLGRSPFHDMQLTCTGQLSYLGSSWRKDVACAGYGVALQGDISAGKMIFGVEGVDPARRSRLIELLDIDLYQRMTTMSDGQRRRVQICMGLLKLYDVLLLDEITVDLDVVGRLRLLQFFCDECEERGATIIYATHIFDGLETWITHAAYMEEGAIVHGGPVGEITQLKVGGDRKLLHAVEELLRKERDVRLARIAAAGPVEVSDVIKPKRTPNMPSKHLMYFH